jgi:hypothetical protein
MDGKQTMWFKKILGNMRRAEKLAKLQRQRYLRDRFKVKPGNTKRITILANEEYPSNAKVLSEYSQRIGSGPDSSWVDCLYIEIKGK